MKLRVWLDETFIATLENAAELAHVHALAIREAHYKGHGEWRSERTHQRYIDAMLCVLRLRNQVDIHVV